jgi:hypothetical protein
LSFPFPLPLSLPFLFLVGLGFALMALHFKAYALLLESYLQSILLWTICLG